MSTIDDLYDELFPGEEGERLRWVEANAKRFKVSELREVEPDHPFIDVAREVVEHRGSFTKEEAEAKVAALEERGIPAYYSPTREESNRLWEAWENR